MLSLLVVTVSRTPVPLGAHPCLLRPDQVTRKALWNQLDARMRVLSSNLRYRPVEQGVWPSFLLFRSSPHRPWLREFRTGPKMKGPVAWTLRRLVPRRIARCAGCEAGVRSRRLHLRDERFAGSCHDMNRDQKLPHRSDQRDLGGLSIGAQPLVVGAHPRVLLNRNQRGHPQRAA